MKRASGCLIVGFLLIFSCSTQERVPPGILNHDQMVNVLAELYMTEQRVGGLGVKRDSVKQVYGVMADTVFSRAHVSDSIFKQSMNYYMDRPKELDLIYGALIDSLNLREQRAVSQEKK